MWNKKNRWYSLHLASIDTRCNDLFTSFISSYNLDYVVHVQAMLRALSNKDCDVSKPFFLYNVVLERFECLDIYIDRCAVWSQPSVTLSPLHFHFCLVYLIHSSTSGHHCISQYIQKMNWSMLCFVSYKNVSSMTLLYQKQLKFALKSPLSSLVMWKKTFDILL